ncbi:hypothetical protein JCM1840_006076 [Sporobolomyces johnsonii]
MNRFAPIPVPNRGPPRPPKVDREKTCPFLLRVFVNDAVHHPDSAFSTTSLPTHHEHQVYVWRDSTLREILILLRDASPTLRASPLTRYSLRLVFWDAQHDRFTSQDLASISARELLSSSSTATGGGASTKDRSSSSSSARGVYANPRLDQTLAEARFVIGDYLDVALILPSGPLSTATSAAGGGGGGGGGGPQFAPLELGVRGSAAARGGPPPFGPPGGGGGGGRDRFGGGGGPRGGAMPPPRADTWAPVPTGGPLASRGGAQQNGPAQWGPRGGAGGGGRGGVSRPPPPPQDQGWGSRRRPSEQEHDRFAPRRRDSRSLSPAAGARRPHSRSPSPPPPRRRDSRGDDVDMRD